MKFYSNFNEMFNAQSDLKSDMSVFNYTVDGTLRIGDQVYTNYGYVKIYPDNVVDKSLLYASLGDNGHFSIEGKYLEEKESQFAMDIAHEIRSLVVKYGLKYDVSTYCNCVKGQWAIDGPESYKPVAVFGREKGRELLTKLYPKLVKIIGEALDRKYRKILQVQELEEIERQVDLQAADRIRFGRKAEWNPEWDADFEDD